MQILFLTLLSHTVFGENGKKRSLAYHSEIITNHLQPIAETHFEQDPNGFYKFSYASPDGTRREESGSGLGGAIMQGSYAYIAPDGTPVQVSYVADENGFRPIGNVISREIQESYFPEAGHELQLQKRAQEYHEDHDKHVSNGSVLKRSHRN